MTSPILRTVNAPTVSALIDVLGNGTVSGSSDTARIPVADFVTQLFGTGSFADLVSHSFHRSQVAISTDTVVGTTHIGQTLYFSAILKTLTFNAATGYDANHFNVVGNTTNRCCYLAVSGRGTIKLWPGYVAIVLRMGSVWIVSFDPIYKAPYGTRVYVDHTNGNAANDGLASGSGNALATIQSAFQMYEKEIDAYGNGVTIYVMGSAFTEGNVAHTLRDRGYHVCSLTSNLGRSGCTWTVPAGQVGCTFRDWSGSIVTGFKMVAAGSGSIGLSTSQTGIFDYGDMEFGDFSGGIHLQSTNAGHFGHNIGQNTIVSGPAVNHWQVTGAGSTGIATGCSYTVAAGLTFTYWAQGTGPASLITAGISWTYSGGSAANTTGQKYSFTNGAAIYSTGDSAAYPGATAGSVGSSPNQGFFIN